MDSTTPTAIASGTFEWQPDAATIAESNVAQFMREHGFTSWQALLERSQAEPAWFWNEMVSWLGIEFETPYSQVVDATDPERATWFVGGTLNLATNCVDRHARGKNAQVPAIHWEGEDGGTRTLSYADLRREVALLADGLSNLGVQHGDRIAIYMPMVPEVVIAMYAAAAVGAIAVPIFSGFAADAIRTRIAHCEARVVICSDATLRRGRQVSMKQTIDEAVDGVGCVEHVIVHQRLGLDLKLGPRDRWWHDLTSDANADRRPDPVDSEHPVLLAYTSGTTGAPKAAVHVHGGLLVKLAEEVHFQVDLRAGEVLHWVTDMGWIMGPWEVIGAHALGATVLLAEGAPDWPDPSRLWKLVERHSVNVLGVSPTLIRALMTHGDEPVRSADLRSLRVFGSTGEPWNPDPWRWLLNVVGEGRCPIINLSGGTEVGACFLSPTPLTSLKPTTLGGPALGMSVEIRDADGSVLGRGDGVGELVCTKPWPGMTRGFWGPDGAERFHEVYWSRWPGVWVHGDWASIDQDGLWYLHGRSDDTINIAGKRIGPAEYESILVSHESVQEAAAIGVPHDLKGEAVWCYAVLAPGKRASDRLRERLIDLVGERLGKAFRPEQVFFVNALPRTRSQKIVRRAIRAAALNEDPGDLSSVENPQAIEAIRRSR
jgi:acetyl-CoA synthetase